VHTRHHVCRDGRIGKLDYRFIKQRSKRIALLFAKLKSVRTPLRRLVKPVCRCWMVRSHGFLQEDAYVA
jgi:hypothetical protein